VLQFETLRAMLLGFANEPVQTQPDPRYAPIMDRSKSGDGFTFNIHGYPDNYNVWIYPDSFHSNTGYMGLRVHKGPALMGITHLTFRIAAYNAGMVYAYKFNFGVGQPELEMHQGRGYSITGERVSYERVSCIDLVVLDLIEIRLPPQLEKYRPEVYVPKWGVDKKPCILCGTSIPNNWYLCAECHPARAVTVV